MLNATGIKQASLVAKRLADEDFDGVYCSDLQRCKQVSGGKRLANNGKETFVEPIKTADAILEFHPNIPMSCRTDLRERAFGSLTGKPIAYLLSESANQGLDHDSFVQQCGGESLQDFNTRVINAYRDIVSEALSQGQKHILVVTHGGPLKTLSQWWIEEAGYTVDPSCFLNNVAPGNHGNTAVTRIRIPQETPHQGIIEVLNSTTHLASQGYKLSDAPASV